MPFKRVGLRHRYYWAALAAFAFLCASARAEIHLAVVIPTYRELHSQNIGRLLSSFANQALTLGERPTLDLVFVVNNTADAGPNIVQENQRTVKFLEDLSARRVPEINELSNVLRKAYVDLEASPVAWKIHVLDFTNPGFESRNIGRIRDVGNQYVLEKLARAAPDDWVISQMDGDVYVSSNYISVTRRTFSDPHVQFALIDLKSSYEPDSSAEIFRRSILGQVDYSVYQFISTMNGQLPFSGSPRIISRGSALKKIKGVPHLTEGEDAELVRRLKAAFPKEGRFLTDVTAWANYRGRLDAFDASYYERTKHLPVELSDTARREKKNLENEEQKLQKNPALAKEYERKIALRMENHRQEVKRRLAGLKLMLKQVTEQKPVVCLNDDPFLCTSWLPEVMQSSLKASRNNLENAAERIAASFPHLLLIPEPEMVRLWARFVSMTEIVWNGTSPSAPKPDAVSKTDSTELHQEWRTMLMEQNLLFTLLSGNDGIPSSSPLYAVLEKRRSFLHEKRRELGRQALNQFPTSALAKEWKVSTYLGDIQGRLEENPESLTLQETELAALYMQQREASYSQFNGALDFPFDEYISQLELEARRAYGEREAHLDRAIQELKKWKERPAFAAVVYQTRRVREEVLGPAVQALKQKAHCQEAVELATAP
jgi:hypothetical protein